jgi:hypothetical protein
MPLRLDAARAFSRHLRAHDADAAVLISAQLDRLEDDGDPTRAAEAEAMVGPAGTAGQLWLGEVISEDLLSVEDPGGAGPHLWAYDADSCSTRGDHRLHPELHSQKLVPALRHALQEARPASLQLLLFGPLEPVLEELDRAGARGCVTALELRCESGPPLAIGEALPALRALTVPAEHLASALGGGHPALECLCATGCRDLASPLAAASAASLPALRHLGLRHAVAGERDLDRLARSGLVERLETLDLVATRDADRLPFDLLWSLRPRLSHLRRLAVGGHLVPQKSRRRFAAWPEVTLASHDRRELLGLDLATTGWPATLR